MKKFLLPLVAVCAVAPAYADTEYGTTPETAKPFPTGMMGWFVPDLSTIPDEVYFTVTNNLATPAQWGDAPTGTDPSNDKQIYVYLSDGGQEAFQRDGFVGSNSYILLPGYEYLVKITPKNTGSFCMGMPSQFMALPPAWEGKYKFYPKSSFSGAGITVQPGETLWIEADMPNAAPLNLYDILDLKNLKDIEKIEAIHIEAPGGTNTGDGLFQPLIKKGKNVIGFTVKADAEKEVYFILSLDINTFICDKSLLRGASMILNEEETYMDAYYTVDRYFNVPQDGTYTFTNHGAKGTTLTVGNIELTDPTNEFAHKCDWDNAKTATVGDSDAKVVMENLKKGDKIFVRSDAFTTLDGGIDNQPYVMVTKGGQSGIADITADGAKLNVSVNGGVLTVESAILASGAEVAVYDMLGRKVAAAAAPAGAASIELNLNAAPGVYVVAIQGNAGSESAKIAVK